MILLTKKPQRYKIIIHYVSVVYVFVFFQKKDKKKTETREQWEQWKVKDSEFVEGNYEQDLQNALLLSKLDYEEKKVVNKQNKKETEEKKDNGKKKKSKAMSLDQFNTMVSGNDTKG